MSSKVIFFEPVFKEKIWGGDKLQKLYQDAPKGRIGEAWLFSAHQNGHSLVTNGEFKGKSLEELWANHRELFGHMPGEKFPLLIKIIDAGDDLSVQVHPDDSYAKTHENGELGKTECWYVLDCSEKSEIIYGINAKNQEELNEMIDQGQWKRLLRSVPIKPGDFIYVPSGTVHALKKGALILEVQQNSDTTYRLYDYDRKDDEGNLRELHIEKSKDVVSLPFVNNQTQPIVENLKDGTKSTLIKSEHFTVEKYVINGKCKLKNNQFFTLVNVVGGRGDLQVEDEVYTLSQGDFFMLSALAEDYSFKGQLDIIESHVEFP